MLSIDKFAHMRQNASMAKPVQIGFRTTPEIKKILEKLAKEGYRTVSQQVEMIVREWLKEHGHLDNNSSG
jgi:hypothetical protein